MSTLQEDMDELKRALHQLFDLIFEPVLMWIDRILRRWLL